MPQHDDGREAKGCGLPPGTTWALVLVVLWMMLVVPAYQRWRYGKPPPPEQSRPAPIEGESQPGRIEGEGRGKSEAPGEADPGAVLVPGQSAAGGLAEEATEIADPAPEGAASSGQGPGPDQTAREELRPEDGLEPEPEPEKIEIETDELIVELTTLGASVERAALRGYSFTPKGTEPLRILMPLRGAGAGGNSFILRPVVDIEGKTQGVDLSGVVWKLEEDSGGFDEKDVRRVTFVTTRGGIAYRKRFVFYKQGHVLGLEIEARNDTRSRKTVEFDLIGPNGIVPDDFAGGRKYAGMETVLGAREGPEEKLKVERISFKKAARGDLTERGLSMASNEWVAVRNRYFTAICHADDQAAVRALYAEAVEPSVPLRGAVTFESGTTAVLGAGTRFLDEVRPGDLVRLDADRTWHEVTAVHGDTRLILATIYEGASPPPRRPDLRRARPTGGPASRWRRDTLLKQPNVAGVMRVSFGLERGGSGSARFRAYLGPMQGDMLAEAGGERGWEKVIAFGWFGSISRLLLGFLKVLHRFTRLFGGILGGYGLAILLLTLAVKGVMFPVMRRSIVSMHKMQRLQPEVAAIKKRYAKDKSAETQRKMQLEIMGLYKKNNVSMFGGCLPMFIQLPMFFALFGMLRNAFELRQEPYLWIRDLTQPEHIFKFGTSLWLLGEGFNLLPVVYLGLHLLQQRLQPKPGDPQAEQQQKMMRYMFLIFPFILYNMPSGLILYFTFSTGFGIVEQWIIRRRLDEAATSPDGKALGPVTAGGAGPVDGKLVGAGRPKDPKRKTAWDRQDERQTRKAEKRKKKREQRDRRSEKGPGGPG